jgi:hypothetical protein
MMLTIIDALISLRPQARFSAEGNEYTGVTWLSSDIPMPTESEATAELQRLQLEYRNKEYQRKRVLEYPPIADYLDGVVKGDQAQIDAYIAACQAVKAKYPKPTE